MVNKKKTKPFQYIALTRNEQLMMQVIYQIKAAASVYEIYKGMVYWEFTTNSPKMDDVPSDDFGKLRNFDEFLKKEKLNPGLAAQYLNKEYKVGLPSFTTTESMCKEFVQNGWLGKRIMTVRGKKGNKTKTLYFLTPGISDALKATPFR